VKNEFLFSVEDWEIKPFFLNVYFKLEDYFSLEDKIELFWRIVNKVLIAKDIEKEVNINDSDIEKEVNELLKIDDIKDSLDKDFTIDDLKLFVKIDILNSVMINNVKESIAKSIKDNPKIVEDIYEKQENLYLKNAYEIYEVWGNKLLDTSKMYNIDDFEKMGFNTRGLGVFAEDEINILFPENIKIVGSEVGSLLEVDIRGDEKLYYFIYQKYDKYKKKYEEVKEEFENFVFNYLMEESLSNIYDKLQDKYDIKYNEELIKEFLEG